MKTLNDGTQVTSRSWYYLLDFNDSNNHIILHSIFKKLQLKELTNNEYIKLLKLAMNSDIEDITNWSKTNKT